MAKFHVVVTYIFPSMAKGLAGGVLYSTTNSDVEADSPGKAFAKVWAEICAEANAHDGARLAYLTKSVEPL